MLTVHVDGQFDSAIRQLTADADRVAKATVAAINKSTTQAKAEVQMSMPRVFDRPTPYAIGAVRVVNANERTLTGEVTLHGLPSSRSVSGHKFLGPQIAGGGRRDKASERRLKRAGIMPQDMQMVPGQGVELDAYGNVPVSVILQILSWFQTYAPTGDRGRNLSERAKERRRRGTRATRGYEYFVADGRQRSGLAPGIYKRVQTGIGWAIKPILMFVRPAKYQPRFEFPQTVQKVVVRDFNDNFIAAFNSAR